MYGEGLGKYRVGWVGYQWQLFNIQITFCVRFNRSCHIDQFITRRLTAEKNIGLFVVLAVLNCKNNFIEIAKFLKIIQDNTC